MRGRSTTDLLILLVAGTVCFALLAFGATIGALRLFRPDTDVNAAESGLFDIINTMIGLLAGFVAGRSGPPPSDKPDASNRSSDATPPT